MLGSQHPDKSAVGRKRTDSASASITEKSNLQLLNEVEAMLSVPAEEMDTDRIEEYLSLLQKGHQSQSIMTRKKNGQNSKNPIH